MLSRVADAVFWMARYMERTNGLLRLIRTSYIASQDEVRDFSWLPILSVYGGLPAAELEAIAHSPVQTLKCLVLDKENPASVFHNITCARENARSAQDHISKEVWQCLNDFYHLVRDKHLQELLQHGDPISALDVLVKQGMMYYGIVDTTMSRGEDFSFLNTGKYIERGILTADIVQIKLSELRAEENSADAPGWRYLLYSLAGYELYLKTNRGNIQANLVLQQVLYNMQFPHAVLYCLHQTNRYAERLRPFSQPETFKEMEFAIGKVMNAVKYSSVDFDEPLALQTFLQEVRHNFYHLANSFNRLYFGNS
jgi:uncharacterized alpha-E superfamily protein